MVCSRSVSLSNCPRCSVPPEGKRRTNEATTAVVERGRGVGSGRHCGINPRSRGVAQNDAQRSHASFVTTSMQIASTLKLAIQQETSLSVSAEAFVVANPDVSNSEFVSWANTMQVAKRFPEVGGLGFIAVVRPAQLSQFVVSDTGRSAGTAGDREVIPDHAFGKPTLLLSPRRHISNRWGVNTPRLRRMRRLQLRTPHNGIRREHLPAVQDREEGLLLH